MLPSRLLLRVEQQPERGCRLERGAVAVWSAVQWPLGARRQWPLLLRRNGDEAVDVAGPFKVASW